MSEIGPDFFRRHPVLCAQELIGSVFHWHGCEGRIVETEAYTEFDDPACHTWNRPSARKFIADHDAGVAYVYLNYGVHWLFNILVKSDQANGFVLFRALEPISGLEMMRNRRGDLKQTGLCSGPGKLTRALGIGGDDHGCEFLLSSHSGIRIGGKVAIESGSRVGISRGLEHLWRFGETGSRYLSKKME